MTCSRSLLFTLAISLLALSGCAGTRAAYKAADSLDEYAAVISEHYAVLLEEAADLRETDALSPPVLARLRDADARVKPLVLRLRPLAEAYSTVQSAENEEALQKALDDAAIALSDFINAVKNARADRSAFWTAPLMEVPS